MSTSAPTLALYRARIPAHAAVLDAVVETHLDDAIEAHTASGWGERYDVAMVYYAAHNIERTPGSGANTLTANTAGALSSSNGQGLNSSFQTHSTKSGEDFDLRTTKYGQRYLEIRNTRAFTAPFAIY